jgi:hypothetical protein
MEAVASNRGMTSYALGQSYYEVRKERKRDSIDSDQLREKGEEE